MVCYNQFGYTLDYYFCRECPEDFHVDYIGIDTGKQIVFPTNPNVSVLDVRRPNSSFLGKLWTQIKYRLICLWKTLFGNYDIIMVKYFVGCSLIAIFKRRSSIMEIRTGSLARTSLMRNIANSIMKLESCFFLKVISVSCSLTKRLRLQESKTLFFPPGTDIIDKQVEHDFNTLKLIYIGTFQGRDLWKVIQGISLFVNHNPSVPILCDFFGSGTPDDEKRINEEIVNSSLQDKIVLHGYVHHNYLTEFLVKSNVGISFIPNDKRYDCQIPTKTLEYLGAGMPVIATTTKENNFLISDMNGVLCESSPESFECALRTLWERRHQYKSTYIKNSIKNFTWISISKRLFEFFREFSKRN